MALDTWQFPKWRYWWVECHFWGGSTGLPLLFFGGEGTAMFFFCIRVSPCSWKAGRVESERTGRDVLTFPVSVLVCHEYYFISKFKWKSDERWDCFCLCLFWYPTSLLANCWACLFWSIEEDGPMEIEIFGFPWSKPLPWENWSALELNSSLSVLPVQMFWSRLVVKLPELSIWEVPWSFLLERTTASSWTLMLPGAFGRRWEIDKSWLVPTSPRIWA